MDQANQCQILSMCWQRGRDSFLQSAFSRTVLPSSTNSKSLMTVDRKGQLCFSLRRTHVVPNSSEVIRASDDPQQSLVNESNFSLNRNFMKGKRLLLVSGAIRTYRLLTFKIAIFSSPNNI
jgi:hypothetical protein